MTELNHLTADEITELAYATVQDDTTHLNEDFAWFDYLPVIRVAFPVGVTIPQTDLHKQLQQEYDMACIADVTIGKVRAVSYMHRDNYDHVVEQGAVA